MHRSVVGLCAALLLLGCGQEEPSAVTVTQADNGKSLNLPQRAILTVTLPSNGTTGYQWQAVAVPPNLKLAASDYAAPPSARGPAVAGEGGSQSFLFHTVASGSGTLQLVYRPAWNPKAQPDETFRLNVQVEE
jgi:predicted secreted protein